MNPLLKRKQLNFLTNQRNYQKSYFFQFIVLITAIIVGILYSVYLIGDNINPLNTEWLLRSSTADPSMYFISWSYLRLDGWHWPLTFSESLAYPTGANISYTDIMPLWAVPLKALSPWLPDNFQYFGCFIAFNFIMQYFWGAQLSLLFVPNNLFLSLVSGILFLIASPLTFRTAHFPLTSQWLILAAIWSFYALRKCSVKHIKKILIFQATLLFLVTGINPYLTVMVLSVIAISICQLFIDKKLKIHKAGLQLAFYIVIVLVGWFFWGLIPTEDSSANTGYGLYSLNLLAIFDSQQFSTFVNDLPSLPMQYEGFNYLGLGLFILLFANIIRGISKINRWKKSNYSLPKFLKNYGLVMLLIIGITLVALSNKIALGSHVILEYPLLPIIGNVLVKFRSSGRFFWVVHYLIILGLLVSTWKLWKPRQLKILLPLIILIQFLDLLPLQAISTSWISPNPSPSDPLKSQVWQHLSDHHNKLIIFPSFQCHPDLTNSSAYYPTLERVAVTQGLKTNSAYLTRYSSKHLDVHCQQLPNQFQQGKLEEDAAYVLYDNGYTALLPEAIAINRDKNSSHLCHLVDGYILCQNKKSLSNQPINSNLNLLIPLAEAQTILDFRGPNNSSLPYQAGGWAVPDPQGTVGTWTEGSQARLLIRFNSLDENNSISLKAYVFPLLTEKHTQQVVDVVVNGQVLDQWEFNFPFTPAQKYRHVLIPHQLIEENQPLEIVFRIKNPVSPKSIGLNEDIRLINLNFEKIELLTLSAQDVTSSAINHPNAFEQ